MLTVNIKRITTADICLLQEIGRQTFTETFAAVNTEENMASYLDENFSPERLTAELNNENSEFYFAVLENEVIGYLKLNFGDAQNELKNSNALEIQRIYIKQAFQGKKVGQLLYEKAIETAKQKNVGYVWLGVWEHNTKAIRFYQKNGFVEFDKHIFQLGDDKQTDIMMKRHFI